MGAWSIFDGANEHLAEPGRGPLEPPCRVHQIVNQNLGDESDCDDEQVAVLRQTGATQCK